MPSEVYALTSNSSHPSLSQIIVQLTSNSRASLWNIPQQEMAVYDIMSVSRTYM